MKTIKILISLIAIFSIIGCSSQNKDFQEGPSLDFKTSSSVSMEDYRAHMLARRKQLETMNQKMDEEMEEAMKSGADKEKLKKALLEVLERTVKRSEDLYQDTLGVEVPEEARKLHEAYVTINWALRENFTTLQLMAEEKIEEAEGEKRQAELAKKVMEAKKVLREESKRLDLEDINR